MHSESLWSTNTVARGKGNKLSVGLALSPSDLSPSSHEFLPSLLGYFARKLFAGSLKITAQTSYDGASPICFAISKDLLSHFILQSPPPMLLPILPPSSIPSPIPLL
ncbi:hypothetical protein V1477_020429 [Vespula maculifrons]|uniref:Uncharacterized protein n=1 Tax=Vespula maculifrons TaxID=7453 RepID=A0ABD2ALY4_VESMC